MCDENCSTTCSLEKEVKRLECENQKLTAKFDLVDTKMKQEIVLYNHLVANYHGMMVKYEACEKQLERLNKENAHFKAVAQGLTVKMEQSTFCDKDLDKSSINCLKNLNDPIMILEESYKTLMDLVCAYKSRTNATAAELTAVEDELDRSSETESCLRMCLENLTVMGDAERLLRDRDEAELWATVDRLAAELNAERCTQESYENAAGVKAVLKKVLIALKEWKAISNSTHSLEEMRADNARLMADLEECREKTLATEQQLLLFTARMAGQELSNHVRKFSDTSSYRDADECKFATYPLQIELDDDSRQTFCTPSEDDRPLSFYSRSNDNVTDVDPSSCSTDVVVSESCDEKPLTRKEWNVNWLLRNTLKRYGPKDD